MGERIRVLRRALDLTQQEFAERIGVKRNTIATYEIGRNKPIDAVMSLICREFNVNEHWLRTGDGEMFLSDPEDELAEKLNLTEFEKLFLKAYMRLPKQQREAFCNGMYDGMLSAMKETEPTKKTKAERMADEYIRILEEELDAAKGGTEKCSVSPHTKEA